MQSNSQPRAPREFVKVLSGKHGLFTQRSIIRLVCILELPIIVQELIHVSIGLREREHICTSWC